MPLVSGMTENDQQHPHIKPADAPPSYTSPNPNFSTSTHAFYNPHTHPPGPHDPNYMTYAFNANAHNNPYDLPHPHQTPQELALTSPTTAPSTPLQFRSHKSMYGHVRGPSELSGEHAVSELSSGPQSPEMRGSGVWKGGVGIGGGEEQFTKSGVGVSARNTAGVSPLIEDRNRDRHQHQNQHWEEVTAEEEEMAKIAAPRHQTSSPPPPPPPPPRHSTTTTTTAAHPPRHPTPYHTSRSHTPSRSPSPSPSSSPQHPILPRHGGGEEEFKAVRNWMAPRNWDSPPQQQDGQQGATTQRRIRRKKRMEGEAGSASGSSDGSIGGGSSGDVQGLGVVGVGGLEGEGRRRRRRGEGNGDGDGGVRDERDVSGGYANAI
ncbi:hypothetical protein PTNB85_09767 [Pyrenophora teres f. teres]|nr:hypothetical protein PTNB85_09767 [Pyrenophora teres f. teres]KAE8858604.1 hypothetical protein PTNB29_07819 [Pyrenophora teres f. teres]